MLKLNAWSFNITANVYALAGWLGIQCIFSPNKSTVNEQIVEILIHSSIDNFLPRTTGQQRTNSSCLFLQPLLLPMRL